MKPEREQELIGKTLLGEEATKFAESDLGKYVIEQIEKEITSAQLEFESAQHFDERKMQELQNRIWRARQLPNWIVGLISEGEQAIQIYRQEKEEQ